ncbi:MAG: hypothetical protein FWD26_00035 [Treponema sp.]|nr:hypothetical protein [Treponema sp.]
MQKNNVLNNITVAKIVTGTYGQKGCTCNCPGCFLGTYDALGKPKYQGTIEQVIEMVSLLPNLKSVILYGNPDISVDPQFCNEAAKYLQSLKKSIVMFTSGIGGAKIIKEIMNGINPESVSINISVDSIDEKKLRMLRGCNISLQNIVDSMMCCNEIKVPFSISTNIWPLTANDDFFNFKKYFLSYGAQKIRFHFGSPDGAITEMPHINEDSFLEIRNKLREVGGRVPAILVTKEEYVKWKLDTYRPQCIKAHKLHVFLEQDGIKAAACCGILAQQNPEKHIVDIRKVEHLESSNVKRCPCAEKSLGYKCNFLIPVCRSFSCPE